MVFFSACHPLNDPRSCNFGSLSSLLEAVQKAHVRAQNGPDVACTASSYNPPTFLALVALWRTPTRPDIVSSGTCGQVSAVRVAVSRDDLPFCDYG